ncbi:hypothetical protein NDU88_000441 [Pleurodeles waltl]|uniref:Uncharacterized protein n=1 Tax=Pleurodeles waltl TaxID=8319 RepID=A0AAV7P8A5_PLEWA|nr:hypothetical protein NDU88_000441 [Pleurodeles waltl]
MTQDRTGAYRQPGPVHQRDMLPQATAPCRGLLPVGDRLLPTGSRRRIAWEQGSRSAARSGLPARQALSAECWTPDIAGSCHRIAGEQIGGLVQSASAASYSK